MSYVQSIIMPNETLVTTAKTHWFIYIHPTLWLIAGLLILFALFKFNVSPKWFLISSPIFLTSLFFYIKAWIYSYSTELAVTSKRVIAKFGFIRRNTTELKHSKVESLQVQQSILGRIFNFGSIKIIGSGGTSAPIPYIKNPLAFRSAALTQDEYERDDD